MAPALPPLPVDAALGDVSALVRRHRRLVLVAPPGAGKTTRVPPALAEDGPVLVLQPRRVAARSLARRIAAERGWTLGEEVGWHVRFERRAGPSTRVLVATEGILTARLLADPLLSGVQTVVLDEFHERTIHADLALALAREAARARGDLRIVVMSATLDAGPVAAYLDDAPVLEVPGRAHPVDVRYRPGLSPAAGVREALAAGEGHVLAFLPGAAEIARVAAELSGVPGVRVLPLHGALPAAEQDAALEPSPLRKVVLATNVAETSLTVEGVTDVVDGGLHKVLRHDPAIALDRLETERISADSAEQRAGRAGRTGPGRAWRLWDPRERLRPQREPDVQRIDLGGPLLDVTAWGGDPLAFAWFERPPAEALERALEGLRALGLVDGARRLTDVGRAVQRLPVAPRLGRALVESGGALRVARACALLAEGRLPRPSGEAAASDLLPLVDRFRDAPPTVARAAEHLHRAVREAGVGPPDEGDAAFCRALLAGFADRVARRREPRSRRVRLAGGHGAVLAAESGVHEAEWLVALEVTAALRGEGAEALVRLASAVDPAWLTADRRTLEHRYDGEAGVVRAVETTWYRALPLSERAVAPDADTAAGILADVLLSRELGPADALLLRRAAFAGVVLDRPALLRAACAGALRLPEVSLAGLLPPADRRRIDRDAPADLEVPSGRRVPLDYREDGTVHAAVKLQELFGLAETPRVGPERVPVTFALLAPSGRPVQVTRDLASFWRTGYLQVRKELRGRYPKHPWPEDPWTAEPTARAKRR